MKKALAGICLAALAVLGLPATASAAADSPIIFASSTSYSGQPRPFSIQVFNRLDGGRVSATVGGRSMSCRATAAPNGVGRWTCTSSARLGLGSTTITARATGGGKSRTTSKRINVSSRFGISGHTSPTTAGGSFAVTGTYDHISGANDFSVRATVTANGATVLGQSGTSCSTSGSSYRCTLSSDPNGTATSYSVRVTESGEGTRSASTTVTVPVAVDGVPTAPSFSSLRKIKLADQPATVSGRAEAGSLIQLVVDAPSSGPNWSAPTTTCTTGPSGTWSCTLPTAYPAGKHTILARAVDPSDPSKISSTSSYSIRVKAAPKPKPEKTPTAEPTPTPTPLPPVEEPPTTSEPKPVSSGDGLPSGLSNLLELLVLALAVLALTRPGPLSRVLGRRSAAFSDAEVDEDPDVNREPVGPGDNSPSWAAFGHEATDYWSRTAPGHVAKHSPFLGRLTVDGVVIRAIFGSAWWLMPIAGVALGIAAAGQTEYLAVPPPVGILLAVLVLSCFDALAGFVATLAFGLLVAGDFSEHGAAAVLATGFLWCSLPLVASAIRPLRRPGTPSLQYRWDRVADLLIAALLAGWVARTIASAMDAIAGTTTGIPAHANQIGLVAVVAVAVRVLLGHAADLWWPERLRFTEIDEDLPEPTRVAVVTGSLVRVAVFGFLGHVFIGSCWQLWAGILLFALPEILSAGLARTVLPPHLRLPLPRGLTLIFGLVLVGTAIVAIAVAQTSSDLSALRAAFVVAGLIPAVIAGARALAEEPREPGAATWDLQLAGAGILVTTTVLALHGYAF